MYQDVYEFAVKKGLTPRGNVEERKVAAHIVLDEKTGEFLRIEPSVDRKRILCPSIGTRYAQAKTETNANPICEKLLNIVDLLKIDVGEDKDEYNPFKHKSWLLIMRDGADWVPELSTVYSYIEHIENNTEAMQELYDLCIANKIKAKEFVSFKLGTRNLEQSECWKEWFENWLQRHPSNQSKDNSTAISCITGKTVLPISLYPTIDAKPITSTSVYLCSFNRTSFESYGTAKLGAPMSEYEGSVVATGIEYLLKDENHHNDIFDIVYWYDMDGAYNLKDIISDTLRDKIDHLEEESTKNKKQESKNAKTYTQMMQHPIKKGSDLSSPSKELMYHVVSYRVPKAEKGRMYLFDKHEGSILSLYGNIRAWYEDTSLPKLIYTQIGDKYELSDIHDSGINNIYQIMFALLFNTEAKDRIGQIKDEFGNNRIGLLYAVLEGRQIPDIFYRRAINAVTKERVVVSKDSDNNAKSSSARRRVALQVIKAYILRDRKEEETMEERAESIRKSPAYNLGRYLAYVQELQADASSRKNTVEITRAYYRMAKTNPQRCLTIIASKEKAYLAKIRRDRGEGRRLSYVASMEEVAKNLEFLPRHFSLEEQGALDLGYERQTIEYAKESLARIQAKKASEVANVD